MKRRSVLPIFIFLFFSLPLTLLFAADSYLRHSIHASVLVARPESAAEKIAGWAEEHGGYYTMKSDTQVVVRFPSSDVPLFREMLDDAAENVLDYSVQAEDVKNDILYLTSAIESREEILKKNTDYLSRTDVSGTLAIEKEVLSILKELEGLKGRLKKLNQDIRFARAEIVLNFMEQSLPEDIPSSFPWINTVDFYSFMQRGLQ